MSRRIPGVIRLGVILAVLSPVLAWAHSASTSYLTITAGGHDAALQWSIALRDLDAAVGLDVNDDGDITWGELRARQTQVDTYALSRLQVSTGGADCVAGPVDHLADLLGDGGYAVLRTTLHCPVAISGLTIRYGALFGIDPNHRALVNVILDGAPHTGILSPSGPVAAFAGSAGLSTMPWQFFQGGVEHLLAGADHVLFIVMLLAPLLLRPRQATAGPMPRLVDAIKLLTAFTIAHGLTLTLAVLDLAHVPQLIAELGIAATVLVTAVDNIVPFLPRWRGPLAFGFGLIHGLGMAGSLGPLHLPPATLAVALLSFSLGLEAAQIAIACAATPVASALRATRRASQRLLPILSAGVAVLAMLWMIERAQRLTDYRPDVVVSTPETRHGA